MTCFACIFRRRTEHQQHDVLNEDCSYASIPGNEIIKLYSYSELKSATNSFSSSLKLGVGGFGSVYKGILRDGTVVAIKVLSSESNQRARQFLTEMIVVAGIIHENLVRLYGCCVEEPHRMLVYDYIENNSIAKTLLGSSQSNIQFNWRSRVKICIGVARGLAFLHEEVRPHVVHRDIKASNILLDKDLTPKISDFGLAKLMPSNMTHISTRVAGTIGYLAPEYASRGQVTRKSDVYSYGVLLLEIVTGRCNTNNNKMPDFEDQYLPEMPQDITNGLLVSQTWTLYECGKLVNIIDNSLIDGLDVEEACRFLKVGLLCTQEDMKLRPSMSTVIRMLTGRKDVDSEKVTKPGMITDLMELKIRSNNKHDPTNRSFITSSGQDTPSSSGTSTHAYTNDFYSSI